MAIQARIPTGLCALHNFVNRFDAEAFNNPDFDWEMMHLVERDDIPLAAADHEEPIQDVVEEMVHADEQHDEIARLMWADYVAKCTRRGIPLQA